MIGQTIALEHPEILDRLVLADTASHMPPETGPLWEERIANVECHGMAPRVEETIERWFTPPFVAGSPDVVERIRMLIRTTAPQGFTSCGRAIQALRLNDRLGEIDAPTLIIVGANDMGTPVALFRQQMLLLLFTSGYCATTRMIQRGRRGIVLSLARGMPLPSFMPLWRRAAISR